MQKLTLLSLLAIISCASVCAQEHDYRFGKVSLDELRMESYEKDPDADAVILYEDNYLSYQFTTTVSLVQEYRVRVKILKPEGVGNADVSVYYYDRPASRENITGIDAAAYNLVDGKIVKTPLKRQYIFTEAIGEYGRLIKFSIPEVREGTVIEYRYRKTSANITDIPSFVFQHDIPVAFSRMQANIPEFFNFNSESTGYVRINVTRDSATESLGSGANTLNYTVTKLKAEGTDIPALKKEPYVWCLDDFRSMLKFELAQIALPYSIVQNFATSWRAVNEVLRKSSFDSHTRINNPFKDEVAAIKAADGTPVEKARAVLRLVQSKMKWNGDYRLFSEGPRAAAGKGTGSSADINFVLMAALKDAGFSVVPVMLSPRHLGRLSYTHPTIDGIHAFVLRVGGCDASNADKYVYVDGTDINSDIDLLPVELSVDRARLYGVDGEAGWCNLTDLAPNRVGISMIVRVEPDGTLKGKIMESYFNQPAMTLSKRYAAAKSKEEYIESLEKEHGIQIEELEVRYAGTAQVAQDYEISRQLDCTDEFIYVNSTVIPFMSTNELNAQSRTLPIEFPQPITYDIRCSLELPEGYAVEELPKAINMTACEKGLSCKYLSQLTHQYLQFNFIFRQPRILFLPSEFQDVNAFYGMVADLSNSRIVLRKTNAAQ